MPESTLPPAVQALIDRQEILACELRYCSGVDRRFDQRECCCPLIIPARWTITARSWSGGEIHRLGVRLSQQVSALATRITSSTTAAN